MKHTTAYHSELILNLNERLFLNTLKGITAENSKHRISDHNNPLIWIATHVIWARYQIVSFLGKSVNNPYTSMFENFKPFDESMKFPTLETAISEWKKVSGLVKEGLASTMEEQLAKESPLKLPVGDNTIGGAIAFLTEHESYEIGQMAFLKKYFTKEAMSYN